MESQGKGGADHRGRESLVGIADFPTGSGKVSLRTKTAALLIVFVLVSAGTAFAIQNQHIEKKLASLGPLEGKFSFVVFGDNRSDKVVYKKMVIMATALKPDFVVTTGDAIETPGDPQEWMAFWSLSKLIEVPFF